MSENKCPVCGERLTGDIDGVVVCWSGCSFRCGSYALPRIAAAMELARAEVAASNAVRSVSLARLESAVEASEAVLFQAKMRALEVFGK